MKFSYIIDPRRKLILQRFAGRFTVAEIIDCVRRLWADPLFDRSYCGLADISGMEAGTDLSDLRALISFLQKERARISTGRWAIVAISPMTTAAAFFYQNAMGAIHPVEVFSTSEAAAEWLGWQDGVPAIDKCEIV